ncbi:hypothetical protein HPB48_000719 [Haemaphysalis longicornis]|uniref:Uncharacterized protein n=1 Tax=Haemaphysalis longicornis TaxID=44386 RepID=A0A9J6FDE8_HAELO|nr:hypothetical protein HPB48_000719 [Haemaphysalis longicornis]
MNLSHRGLHHKAFQGHLKTKLVQASEACATASEAASAAVVKTIFADLLNPVGNIDVIFGRSWLTRGQSSHIGVGCIIELYSGLVLDHVVFSEHCGVLEKTKAQEESLRGRGRLTQDRIEKIQSCYGYALRSNRNDVPGMKRAVEATLLHMTSTASAPNHSKGPNGDESW